MGLILPSVVTSDGASVYISESATGVWEAEWPLVGGESKDSPLVVGFSTGSCGGSGATDNRVLPWFCSSTWNNSSA